MNDETDMTEEDPWADAMAEQAEGEAARDVDDDVSVAVDAELPEIGDAEGGEVINDGSLDVILDIPVVMSLEVGRADVSIRQLLKLKQGSVVELDRVAGDPLDVLVNGTLVAHGEVVVVNDKYGIRLTDVLSPKERIRQLR